MGHPKVVAALALVPLALGCASLRGSLEKSLRREGTANLSFPEVVWREYDCDSQRLPFFLVEYDELVPPRVRAGGEFNHRMVYVMCPEHPTEVLAGPLATRIRFKGVLIHGHLDPHFEIQPGRWQVDTFVELPDDAEDGVYAYEIAFESEQLRFERSLTFLVLGD